MERAAAKKRVNDIALARFERWALPAMARRLPPWVTPDNLTGLGLVAAAGIGASYWATRFSLDWLWAASALLVVHWWADSLDGTLARVRRIQRERYGFYVDHQCDALSALFMFAGLAASSLMNTAVALALLAAYYLLMILVSLVTIARDVFKISFGRIGPTEGRLVMIAANTAAWALANPQMAAFGRTFSLFDGLGLAGIVGMGAVYVVASLRERSTLAALDPPPRPGEPEPEEAHATTEA